VINVLSSTSKVWALRVVPCHVAGSTATSGVFVGLECGSDKVFWFRVIGRIVLQDIAFISSATLKCFTAVCSYSRMRVAGGRKRTATTYLRLHGRAKPHGRLLRWVGRPCSLKGCAELSQGRTGRVESGCLRRQSVGEGGLFGAGAKSEIRWTKKGHQPSRRDCQ
jgi:hypothetical protein